MLTGDRLCTGVPPRDLGSGAAEKRGAGDRVVSPVVWGDTANALLELWVDASSAEETPPLYAWYSCEDIVEKTLLN